eukprot:4730395-Pleurochrysis_carterae.AAC.2
MLATRCTGLTILLYTRSACSIESGAHALPLLGTPTAPTYFCARSRDFRERCGRCEMFTARTVRTFTASARESLRPEDACSYSPVEEGKCCGRCSRQSSRGHFGWVQSKRVRMRRPRWKRAIDAGLSSVVCKRTLDSRGRIPVSSSLWRVLYQPPTFMTTTSSMPNGENSLVK